MFTSFGGVHEKSSAMWGVAGSCGWLLAGASILAFNRGVLRGPGAPSGCSSGAWPGLHRHRGGGLPVRLLSPDSAWANWPLGVHLRLFTRRKPRVSERLGLFAGDRAGRRLVLRASIGVATTNCTNWCSAASSPCHSDRGCGAALSCSRRR